MQKNIWSRDLYWVKSGSTYYQEYKDEIYQESKYIAVGDIYFRLNKYLTGVTFTYINNINDIYKIDLLTGDGLSIVNNYNEYDVIDRCMKNIIFVDVSPNVNIDIKRQIRKIDGVTLKPGHLVLLKNQDNNIENDIYLVDNNNFLVLTDYLSNRNKSNKFSCSVKLGSNIDKQFFLNNSGDTFPVSFEPKDFIEGQSFIVKNLIKYNLYNTFNGDISVSTICNDIPIVHPTTLSFKIGNNLNIQSGSTLLIYYDWEHSIKCHVIDYDINTGDLIVESLDKIGTGNFCDWKINILNGFSGIVFTDFDFARKQLIENSQLYDFLYIYNIDYNITPNIYFTIKYHHDTYSIRSGNTSNIFFTGNTFDLNNNRDFISYVINSSATTYLSGYTSFIKDSLFECNVGDYISLRIDSGSTNYLTMYNYIKDIQNDIVFLEETIPNYILNDLKDYYFIIENLNISDSWSDALNKFIDLTPYSRFYDVYVGTYTSLSFNIRLSTKEDVYNKYFDYDGFTFEISDGTFSNFKFETTNQYINYKLFDFLNNIDPYIFNTGFSFFNSYTLTGLTNSDYEYTSSSRIIVKNENINFKDFFVPYTYINVESEISSVISNNISIVYDVFENYIVIEKPRNWDVIYPIRTDSPKLISISNIDGLKNISDILYHVYMNSEYDWYNYRTDNERKYIANAYGELLHLNDIFRSKVTGILYENINHEPTLNLYDLGKNVFDINNNDNEIYVGDNNLYYLPLELIFIGADRKSRLPVPINFNLTTTTTTLRRNTITTTSTTIVPTTTTTTTVFIPTTTVFPTTTTTTTAAPPTTTTTTTPTPTTTTTTTNVELIYYGVSTMSVVDESYILSNFSSSNQNVGTPEGKYYIFPSEYTYKYWCIPDVTGITNGYKLINNITSGTVNDTPLAYTSYYNKYQVDPMYNTGNVITYHSPIMINGLPYRIYRTKAISSVFEYYVYSF